MTNLEASPDSASLRWRSNIGSIKSSLSAIGERSVTGPVARRKGGVVHGVRTVLATRKRQLRAKRVAVVCRFYKCARPCRLVASLLAWVFAALRCYAPRTVANPNPRLSLLAHPHLLTLLFTTRFARRCCFLVAASFDLPLSDGPPRYPGDTYFIAGGQSKYVRVQNVPAIEKVSHLEGTFTGYLSHPTNPSSQLFPRHMLATIRGCGHWVHAENPADVLSLIGKYIEHLEAQGG